MTGSAAMTFSGKGARKSFRESVADFDIYGSIIPILGVCIVGVLLPLRILLPLLVTTFILAPFAIAFTLAFAYIVGRGRAFSWPNP